MFFKPKLRFLTENLIIIKNFDFFQNWEFLTKNLMFLNQNNDFLKTFDFFFAKITIFGQIFNPADS